MAAEDVSPIHVTDILKVAPEQELKSLLPNTVYWEHFNLPIQSFPRIVYDSQAISHFGYFVDLLLRVQLHCGYPKLCDISKSNETEQIIFSRAISGGKNGWKALIPNMIKCTGSDLPSDLTGKYPRIWSLLTKFSRDVFKTFSALGDNAGSILSFNKELINSSNTVPSQLDIQGHPDIIWYSPSHNGIIDIKTVRKPSSSCISHMAQVCTYAAMLRETGKSINYIGIYYPLQKEPLVLFDLPKSWDHLSFLRYLRGKIPPIVCNSSNLAPLLSQDLLSMSLQSIIPFTAPQTSSVISECATFALTFASMALPPGIGYHVEGCSKFLDSISNISDQPIQAFLSPRTGPFPQYDIKRIKSTLIANNLVGFSHMPFYINLCKPETKLYPDPMVSLGAPIRELDVANQMGLKGCVIHTGCNIKKLNINLKEAINRMKYYTLWLVCHANPECPLLLETSCGAGTETLSDVESFCDFYEEIIRDYPSYYKLVYNKEPTSKPPFGLCIDTCHVFQANQNPSEFISRVVERIGTETIKLIHYNDSKNPKGSHIDRHQIPSFGQIPIEELFWTYTFALANHIPMVRE